MVKVDIIGPIAPASHKPKTDLTGSCLRVRFPSLLGHKETFVSCKGNTSSLQTTSAILKRSTNQCGIEDM